MKNHVKKMLVFCLLLSVGLLTFFSCDRGDPPEVEPPSVEREDLPDETVTSEAPDPNLKFVLNDGGTGYVLEKYEGDAETVVIPSLYLGLPVTEIGHRAFAGKHLLEITIPEGVRKINDSAFQSCEQLKKLTLSDGLIHIGAFAFSGCGQLTSVQIPEGVTCIDEYAFSYCHGLKEIQLPNSLTKMGRRTFETIQGLSHLQFSSYGGARYLGNDQNPYLVLYDCETELETGSVHPQTQLIVPEAFADQVKLKEMTIEGRVANLYADTFLNCTGLERIFFGMSMKYVDPLAFSNCPRIRQIEVDLSNSMYQSVGNCLINVKNQPLVLGGADAVIPQDGSVLKIGAYAFYQRQGMTELQIPSSVQVVRKSAFAFCEDLHELVLPKGQLTVMDSAFDSCRKLSYVYFEGVEEDWALMHESVPDAFGDEVTICYYYDIRPMEIGTYWRYVEGVPVRWTFIGDE